MDLNNPQSWRDVKVNDIVLLSDQQALQDSVKAGLGLKPLQYTVSGITRVLETYDAGKWLLYNLKPTAVKQELMLMVKIIDDNMDVRLYYETDFQSGSRSDIIKRGDLFLFQPPENPDDFKASQLKFTADITQDGNRWVLKPVGELHGQALFSPPRDGMTDVIATMAEYALREGDSLDTEILIMELGKGPEGLVKMFAGCAVNLSEIEIFPV